MADNTLGFKLISAGIQTREIDNSQVPASLEEVGPVIIGRAQRGPSMRPVKVNSYSEFIQYFGEPSQNTDLSDVWRDNIVVGPSYGSMAAQASLLNKNALTYVRLLGVQHPEATNAGLAGWKYGTVAAAATGGAYGLFLFPSASGNGAATHPNQVGVTGTLGAIFYCTGTVMLSGSLYEEPIANVATTGTAVMVLSDTSKNFCMMIKDQSGNLVEKATFNFTPSSDKFIRKVFNTNPVQVNPSLFSTAKTYWLGESYEDFINASDEMGPVRSADRLVGVVMGMANGSTTDQLCIKNIPAQHSRTGWFVSQHLGAANTFNYDNLQKLFKIHAFDSGEWAQGNIKVSIRNIKITQNEFDRYGTFDVLVRSINDSDSNLVILEQFNGCNLNPNSPNYIGKMIGDKYVTYSTTDSRNIEIGQYDNRSKFIRVEMDSGVDAGVVTPECLPFGVYGPVKFKNTAFSSGSALVTMPGSGFGTFGTPAQIQTSYLSPFILASSSIAHSGMANAGTRLHNGVVNFGTGTFATIKSCSIAFPYPRLRGSSLSGTLRSPTDAFFGVYTDDTSGRFSSAVKDLVRAMPLGVDSFSPDSAEGTDYAWRFTLDDLTYAGSSNDLNYTSGSRVAETSVTAVGSNTYNTVLTGGFGSFTTVLAGGFDGLDIKEIEPFNNTDMTSVTSRSNYAYNTVQRAISILQHPEDSEFSDAAIPGVNVPGLTRQLIEVCSERGSALAVIDLENDFIPRSENSSDFSSRLPNLNSAITSLKNRGLNTSYGAAYFPWVQGLDITTNNLMWLPPSVVMLGVFAYNDRVGYKHSAPAGFNRGGLSDGHGGVPVTNVSLKLLEKERDKLYQANINPIAKLSDKVVVWGQKTLQVKQSAFDRINIRRGILDIRRKFSKIAKNLIFEPNVSDTWQMFIGQAIPILDDIVAKLGLEEYKLKMDTSTNTPDLRDRNIIYAKVYLRPTKTAEFFFLDFNISSSGAAFVE